LENRKDRAESVIQSAAGSWKDIIPLLHKSKTGGSDVSHTIFHIFPAGGNRLLSRCHFGPVSPWALDRLLHYCEESRAHAAANFYYYLSSIPEAAVLRGHLFERQVLDHLCSIQTERPFSTRGLTNSEEKEWIFRGPIQRIDLEDSTVSSKLAAALGQKSLHFVPLFRSFPAVDSVLYDPKDENAALTCIQITRNKKDHPIDVPGLQRIQSWLKLQTPLEVLRPTKDKPWRFLFVVQSGMEAGFKLQKLKLKSKLGSDECHESEEWAAKVYQCVLGLEEETVFGKRSESASQPEKQQVWY